MIEDIDFSGLECISAVKNISKIDDYKAIICTITFLKEEDSIKHLTGIEELIAKLALDENNKWIKLTYALTEVNGEINIDAPIKVFFNGINTPYRKSSRCKADSTEVLVDVKFIDEVFDRSPTELKFIYL